MRRVIICLLGLLLVACGPSSSGATQTTRSPTVVPTATSPPRPDIGKEAHVWANGLPEWHFAATRDALEAWNKGVQANDTIGLRQMVTSGKAFPLKDGTKVLVLDQDFFVTNVRVLEGTYAGRSAWVNYEHVR